MTTEAAANSSSQSRAFKDKEKPAEVRASNIVAAKGMYHCYRFVQRISHLILTE